MSQKEEGDVESSCFSPSMAGGVLFLFLSSYQLDADLLARLHVRPCDDGVFVEMRE